MLADNGYFSEANVKACEAAGVEPLIAMGRDGHHPSLHERFAEAPPAPENPTPVEAMAHRLTDARGQKALRQAQAHPRAGVRHHQIRARIPPIFAARAGKGQRRVEPRHHGLEYKADVRPRPCLTGEKRSRAPQAVSQRASNPVNTAAPEPPQHRKKSKSSKSPAPNPHRKPQSDGLLAAQHSLTGLEF